MLKRLKGTLWDQLWRNKYLNKYGEPKRNIEESWRNAFRNRYSLYAEGKVYNIISYRTDKNRKETVAIFRGELDDIYDKLSDILNNKITSNQNLYHILEKTYKLYQRSMEKYFGSELMTVKQCYEENPNEMCEVHEYLAELPITGNQLKEIIKFHENSNYGNVEYLIIEEYPLYIV